jgi:hypothetical protein
MYLYFDLTLPYINVRLILRPDGQLKSEPLSRQGMPTGTWDIDLDMSTRIHFLSTILCLVRHSHLNGTYRSSVAHHRAALALSLARDERVAD